MTIVVPPLPQQVLALNRGDITQAMRQWMNDLSQAVANGGGGTSSPLTTKGDLWGFSTTDARFPIGANGSLPVANSTDALGLEWNGNIKQGTNPPLAASFGSLVNSPTFTDKVGRLQVIVPNNAGSAKVVGGSIAIPTSPFTIDFCGGITGFQTSGATVAIGVGLTDGTKFWVVWAGVITGQPCVRFQKWNTSTTLAFASNLAPCPFGGAFWLRITCTASPSSILSAYASVNGRDWVLVFTEPNGTFINATRYGIFGYNDSSTSLAKDAKVFCTELTVTNSILGDDP